MTSWLRTGRVQLRCVAGQELQLDLLGVSLDPCFDLFGAVHGMAVEDQDDLLSRALADQTAQEVDEHGGDEFLLQHPEGRCPLFEIALITFVPKR